MTTRYALSFYPVKDTCPVSTTGGTDFWNTLSYYWPSPNPQQNNDTLPGNMKLLLFSSFLASWTLFACEAASLRGNRSLVSQSLPDFGIANNLVDETVSRNTVGKVSASLVVSSSGDLESTGQFADFCQGLLQGRRWTRTAVGRRRRWNCAVNRAADDRSGKQGGLSRRRENLVSL